MQTFKFEELTDPAKEKARQWYAANTDNYWAEHIVESAKKEGLKRGFSIEDILWRGFSSQGDGASWTGRVDMFKFIDHHLKPDNPDFTRYTMMREMMVEGWLDHSLNIDMRSFHYTHSGGMVTDGFAGYAPDVDDCVMHEGILEGASVQQLFDSINVDDLLGRATEWVLDEAKRYADDIYKQLEKEYDYEISDEHIQETAAINEWRFDEDGCIV